jgi:hypothetical protein
MDTVVGIPQTTAATILQETVASLQTAAVLANPESAKAISIRINPLVANHIPLRLISLEPDKLHLLHPHRFRNLKRPFISRPSRSPKLQRQAVMVAPPARPDIVHKFGNN